VGRGLERVYAGVSDEGYLTLTCLCDCATITCVTIEGCPLADLESGRVELDQEWAYTCDGCGSSHWVTTYVAMIGGQL
jgi:hypothetical protein